MVPGVLTLAPRFVLVRDLGMVNTPYALISVWVSGGLVLSTWLMRSYFESLRMSYSTPRMSMAPRNGRSLLMCRSRWLAR